MNDVRFDGPDLNQEERLISPSQVSPVDTMPIDKALAGLCHRENPRSLVHGILLQGLGRAQQRVLVLVGMISMLGSMVTFVSIFVEGESKVECPTTHQDGLSEEVGVQKWHWAVIDRGSVAQEWGLECEQAWKLALVKSLYFAGAMFGVTMGGVASDVYGRRATIIGAWSITCVCLLGSAFAPSWTIYAALRFLLGASANAGYLVGFALAMEWIPSGYRTCIGTGFIATMFAIGELGLVFIGMAAGAMANLLVVGASSGGVFGAERGDDESHASGKYTGLLDDDAAATLQQPSSAGSAGGGLLSSTLQRVSTWTMVLMWFTAALVYYGLTLNAASLAGNFYLNAALSALSELPASLIACLLLERPEIGRRRSVFLFYALGGACCMGTRFARGAGATALYMLGKLALTAAFDSIYQYSSELFAVPIRSRMMGLCSAGARVGSVAAPQAVVLGTLVGLDPSSIFGIASLLTAVAAVTTLPETRRSPVQDTCPPDS
eukprot:CAMPEP_0114319066 /NCGR_PEP_ID=MMETSP0059-20121206/25029_1 /TAXON_ID=36894 /ORGANISM="Pyramimonas parkeae, Strain CCMP726" /LENGTH=492 /DNA_ID=CAMNT_0001446021 /DNA_START=198 /DNA_END=1676 /DNA_ORIENTATION=-